MRIQSCIPPIAPEQVEPPDTNAAPPLSITSTYSKKRDGQTGGHAFMCCDAGAMQKAFLLNLI